MRNYVLPCRNCELEFDGTVDGPKAYGFFCPLHLSAERMLQSLHMARVYVASQWVDRPGIPQTLIEIDVAISAAEGRNSLFKGHRDVCAFCRDDKPCAVAREMKKLSPIAPVGAPLVGSPVAAGANLPEGREKQT